jgi:hypothetical protein
MQAGEVWEVLSLRLLPPLLLAAASTSGLAWAGVPAASALSLVAPATLCALAPVPPSALAFAHDFRLNESLAAAITRAGVASSMVLMPLVGAAAAFSAALGSVRSFCGVTVAAAVLVALTAVWAQQDEGPQVKGRVRMLYAGPDMAAAAAAAASDQAQGGGAAGGERPPPPAGIDRSQQQGGSSVAQAVQSRPRGARTLAVRRSQPWNLPQALRTRPVPATASIASLPMPRV